MNSKLQLIEEPNLSVAWSRAFILLSAHSNAEISPLVVSVTSFNDGVPQENITLRAALDSCLEANKCQSVHTTANTIFPQTLWRMAKGNRQNLYEAYLENLPSYVGMASTKNNRGIYFARLIAYHTDPKTGNRLSYIPTGLVPADGNQLEFIIENCKPTKRRSMFQASVFDPIRDHTRSAQLGFPCLQHLSFVPDFVSGTLQLNAFYATQQAFVRAYGNYLGLCRLGAFVAGETNLTFARMTCFIGVEKMDKRPPADEPTWNALKVAVNNLIQTTAAQPKA